MRVISYIPDFVFRRDSFFEELNDPFRFSCHATIAKFNLGRPAHQSPLSDLFSVFEPNGQTSMFLR